MQLIFDTIDWLRYNRDEDEATYSKLLKELKRRRSTSHDTHVDAPIMPSFRALCQGFLASRFERCFHGKGLPFRLRLVPLLPAWERESENREGDEEGEKKKRASACVLECARDCLRVCKRGSSARLPFARHPKPQSAVPAPPASNAALP